MTQAHDRRPLRVGRLAFAIAGIATLAISACGSPPSDTSATAPPGTPVDLSAHGPSTPSTGPNATPPALRPPPWSPTGTATGPAPTPTVSADPGVATSTPAPATSATAARPELAPGIAYFEGGDFYAPPDPLPEGRPGEIIRVQFAYDFLISNADVLRVMYHSRNRNNVDRAVTGIIAIPHAPAPVGGRPIVSWAHGTTGIGPLCAPSRHTGDQLLGQHFLDAGYLWVATDYDGLGPPGQRHPYLSGYTEGFNVIDIVKAARRIPTTGAGRRWVAYGHSQGGQAALFAAQLAPSWAPDLELLGAVASAPAWGQPLISSLDTPSGRSYAVMLVAGLPTDYPQMHAEDALTDKALAQLPIVDQGCGKEVAVAFRAFGPDETLKAGAAESEPLRSILAENVPGQTRIEAPVLVPHGTLDATIPIATSEALEQRLCAQGQIITRTLYEGEDHGGVIMASADDVDRWITERFAGRPAPSDC